VRLREICAWEDSAASGEILKRLDDIEGISRELQSFVKRHPTLNAKKWRDAVGVVRGNKLTRIRLHHIVFLRDKRQGQIHGFCETARKADSGRSPYPVII